MVKSTDLTLTGFRSDYNALKEGPYRPRRTGLPAMGASADWHFKSEFQYLKLMELARDVMRNDIVVGQAVRRLTDNVLQGGFPVDPQTGDADADAIILDSWLEWTEDRFQCHFNQTLNFSKIEELSFQSMIVDGGIFALPTDQGSLDTLEYHRSQTPGVGNRSATKKNVVLGVLLDDFGTPQEYWFTTRDIGFQQASTVSQMTRRPVRDADGEPAVFHLVDQKRVSQTKGVTAFVPCFDVIGMHNDRQFAELVKANIQSCFVWAREMQQWAASEDNGTAGEVEIRNSVQATRLLQHIYPGMEITLKRGEKLVTASPQVAGADFITHTHLILQFLAVNLDQPVAVMLLDPSLTNFSGWRGAIEQARITWRRWQCWLIDHLHRPTYRWKVRGWAAENSERGRRLRKAAAAGANLFKHVWTPAGWAYIEPLKDTQSDILEWTGGVNSRRRVLARKQLNVKLIDMENVEDLENLIDLARAAAERQNKKYPDLPPVDWQIFLPGMPKGMSLAMQPAGEPVSTGDAKKAGAGK